MYSAKPRFSRPSRQNQFLVASKAAKNPASVYDFTATVLHLMGLDHEHLTYYHNGLERRLTNGHGHVIQDVLA